MADAAEKDRGPGTDSAIAVNIAAAAMGVAAVATACLVGSQRGTWNWLCVAGGLLIIAILAAPRREAARVGVHPGWVMAIVAALWATMPHGFVSDDFVLLAHARRSTLATLAGTFVTAGGDGFYRPVGYVWLGLNSWWAGDSRWLWGFLGAAVHVGNTFLVYLMARRWPGLEQWQAAGAALLFGVHGSLVESAGWLAGSFDVVSTSFVLAALLFLDGAFWLALLCMGLAQLTKEAAYAFPLLAAVWMAARDKWRPATLTGVVLATGAVFAWRSWLLGGIGGYAPEGVSQLWDFGWLGYVKVLAWRLWGGLFFPLKAGAGPKVLLVVLAAGLVAMALQARRHASVWWAFALLFTAVVVPAHLMLFGPDLLKSRLLYLPLVGFSIALAAAARRPAGLALYVIAQIVVLRANGLLWQNVARTAEAACAAAVRCEAGTTMPRMPATLDGVYFFANGFSECVARAAGKPFTPAAKWDEGSRKIECFSPGASPGPPGSSGSPPAAKD